MERELTEAEHLLDYWTAIHSWADDIACSLQREYLSLSESPHRRAVHGIREAMDDLLDAAYSAIQKLEPDER